MEWERWADLEGGATGVFKASLVRGLGGSTTSGGANKDAGETRCKNTVCNFPTILSMIAHQVVNLSYWRDELRPGVFITTRFPGPPMLL